MADRTIKNGLFLSVLSGLLLSLAFPKAGLSLLVWVALAPFFVALFSAKTSRMSALFGLVLGVTFFVDVLFWMTSLFPWIGFFSLLAWLLLAVLQAVFFSCFALFSFFVIKKYNVSLLSVLAIPLLWVGQEILRSRGEFATSAGVLGYTQYKIPAVIQIASLFKVYGVSFVIVLVNFSLAILIVHRKDVLKVRNVILFSCAILISVLLFGFWKLSVPIKKGPANGLRMLLVQPNFAQDYKMRPSNSLKMVDALGAMTLSSLPADEKGFHPQVVIWPETAVMDFPMRSTAVMGALSKVASGAGTSLITGGFFYDNGKLYNSAFCVSPLGYITSRYDKEHLMPFGEYLPMRDLLYPLLKGTGYVERDQSPNTEPVSLYIGGRKAGVLICFESLFDDLAARRAKRSDFLLTITNDAWFGNSSAAYHHIMAGPFRAVENGKYFVQVANSGISAVIDPRGRFVQESRLCERTVIRSVIYLDSVVR